MKLGWRRSEELRCRDVGKVLQSYLDGEIDEVLAHRVVQHLEMCRRCGMTAQAYTSIKQALRRSGESPPEDAISRLRAFGEQLADGWVPPGEEDTGTS